MDKSQETKLKKQIKNLKGLTPDEAAMEKYFDIVKLSVSSCRYSS